MSTEQTKEETVFHRAIQIESAAERADFLRSACGDDSALVARVEALLRVHYDNTAFLKVRPVSTNGTLDASPLREGPGTMIGRYKLLQRIGEGGFGVVYMAEQTEPVKR